MAKEVFVAREHELAWLQRKLDGALAGRNHIAFVAGEAGSGKTTLVREFARQAQRGNGELIVALGMCNAPTGLSDPFLPFSEVLRVLLGDVDGGLAKNVVDDENRTRLRKWLTRSTKVAVGVAAEIVKVFVPMGGLVATLVKESLDKSGVLDDLEKSKAEKSDDLHSERFFEQYTKILKTLAADKPLLLILDDLQWADESSISLLFHLIRSVSETRARILFLGLYRADEVEAGRGGAPHPLGKILDDSKRYYGDICIDMGRVQEAEGRRFVDDLIDTERNRLGDKFRQRLFQHTGGHPLFTVELLRALQERKEKGVVKDKQGYWVEGSALDWKTLPPKVEGVIKERIKRLAKNLYDILSVASVEGQTFTPQVVARVNVSDELDLLRNLSQELEKRHRLVHESTEFKIGSRFISNYRFNHALLQQYLYDELGSRERRLLHSRIASLLEELYEGQTYGIAPQLAHHYMEGGEGKKAVEYLLQAGDRALKMYASQEATEAYHSAIRLLKEEKEYERAARTLMKLGLAYLNAFKFQEASYAFTEFFTLSQAAETARPALHPAPHALRTAWPDPRILDSAMATHLDSGAIIDPLFSGLLEYDAEMNVVPEVVSEWEILDGGRTYVFHLRDDVRWSNGDKVTAADFEFAWKRVLDPATKSPNAGHLYVIKGAQAYHRGEAQNPAAVGVHARDDTTLIVELESPISHFPHMIAYHAAYAVPQQAVSEHGSSWADPDNIVTNGPFRLESWESGQRMTFARNRDYYGKFAGNVERVEVALTSEEAERLQMYENGEIDILPLVAMRGGAIAGAQQKYIGEYLMAPELSTYYIGFNVRQPPFDDRRVRRAFAHAVDQKTLVNLTQMGVLLPAAGGFIPAGMVGHSAEIGLPYDPDRARHLLAEAGYPDGRGFPAVRALAVDSNVSTPKYLHSQWEKILGVDVTWEKYNITEFNRRLADGEMHMYSDGWMADYPDPDSFLRVASFLRQTGWQNETYTQLVDEAQRVMNQEERMRLYQSADAVLVGEATIIPISYGRRHLLVKPWVKNFRAPTLYWWYWQDIIIDPH